LRRCTITIHQPTQIKSYDDYNQGKKVFIVGTLYKEMKLKPSVLDQFKDQARRHTARHVACARTHCSVLLAATSSTSTITTPSLYSAPARLSPARTGKRQHYPRPPTAPLPWSQAQITGPVEPLDDYASPDDSLVLEVRDKAVVQGCTRLRD